MYRRPGTSFGMAHAKEYCLSAGSLRSTVEGNTEQFVGERADGGEHPRAAQDDAVVVLAGDVRHQRARSL